RAGSDRQSPGGLAKSPAEYRRAAAISGRLAWTLSLFGDSLLVFVGATRLVPASWPGIGHGPLPHRSDEDVFRRLTGRRGDDLWLLGQPLDELRRGGYGKGGDVAEHLHVARLLAGLLADLGEEARDPSLDLVRCGQGRRVGL